MIGRNLKNIFLFIMIRLDSRFLQEVSNRITQVSNFIFNTRFDKFLIGVDVFDIFSSTNEIILQLNLTINNITIQINTPIINRDMLNSSYFTAVSLPTQNYILHFITTTPSINVYLGINILSVQQFITKTFTYSYKLESSETTNEYDFEASDWINIKLYYIDGKFNITTNKRLNINPENNDNPQKFGSTIQSSITNTSVSSLPSLNETNNLLEHSHFFGIIIQ
ncbi:hypothetical protein HZS_3635 [Henneguya salminicola]|nr:hypothetical protein HZS_3635 [Henneguya salminicola]